MEGRSGRARQQAENLIVNIVESVRDTVVERMSRPSFSDAEAVVFALLDERIATLNAKTKPTASDQHLRGYLKLLKVDLGEALTDRWENRDARGTTDN